MKIKRSKLKEMVREAVITETEYSEFFKRALEKAGKSIPDMSDDEKKKFFDKIDAAWKGKGEKREVGEVCDEQLDESLSGDVMSIAKQVEKKGGNSVNITDYGLSELASHFDNYGPKSREPLYSTKTVGLFSKLVLAMAQDEIQNNQDDNMRR